MNDKDDMRILRGIYFFYTKLIVPSLALSILIAYFRPAGVDWKTGIGISLIFLLPVFHYFSYELRSPQEYYFYHNLGLSRLILWLSTIIIGLIFGLALILI
ncbi:hypothetical protein [Pedobacter sp. GR22-6]|uniref:hypothetical protein n=1 Tax=Pedobacter sp. GR22-6 TaxID=3127957 RepID=UPI00307EE292